jgi:tetratricopeptide (TPR) repeat protein
MGSGVSQTSFQSANRLLEIGDCVGAIILYSKLLKEGEEERQAVRHDAAKIYSQRAIAYLKLQKVRLALEDSLKAIEYDPLFVDGYSSAGKVRTSLVISLVTIL